MNAIPCTAPQTGLCFPSAPGKRQKQRSTLPVSEVFLRPKSARIPAVVVSQSPACRGWRDARSQGRAPLCFVVFQPASSRHHAGSFPN